MFYGTKRRFEGMKALLSVAAIATGLMLSNMAASSPLYMGNGQDEVLGVWQWVTQGEEEASDGSGPVFEIRRAVDGHLEALIKVRSGDPVHGADVKVDGDQVCMVTGDGASFSGELSDDGLRIRGVIYYGGESSSVMLERVVRRKMPRAAGRKAYAT